MRIVKFSLMILLCCGHSLAYAGHHQATPPSASQASPSQLINGRLLVENGRAQSTIPGVKVSAGYLKLTNISEQSIRFTGVSSSAAKHTEFHRMVMHDNKMAMRKVDVIEIKAQQSVELKEHGHHLMFMGIKQQFKPGESVPVTLIEDSGQTYELLLPIVAIQHH